MKLSRRGLRWALAALLGALLLADQLAPPPLPGRGTARAQVVLARDGTPLRAFPDRSHVWRHPLRLDEVSPRYVDAVLAYEDRFFYWHFGINPVALLRAAGQWLWHGRIVSGGSTLTMQVARLLEPVPRTPAGKLRQMLRAVQLELRLSKREILELYLSYAPMGGVLEGVEAASRAYLGKPAASLSHGDAALLAVLPQAPSRLRPDRYPAAARAAAAAELFARLRARGHPGLILATGGTTGAAKLVLHDLAVLLATVPVRLRKARRILPLMRFDHIGGLDIAWRALAAGHVLVGPPPAITPEAVAATIERHAVEVLVATPSFLNLMLAADVHHRHTLGSLRTVPYGAEPMPAGLLEQLRLAWPQVRFVQRFGTSETGALPVAEAGDGLVLAATDAGFAWKLVEGEIWVRSPSCALGYLSGENGGFAADGWFRTGDLAERLPDGSVRIVGRREELINVGGEKVVPAEVEDVLHAHPHVADCRVYPERNALLGQVVAAELVWRGPETDPVAVKRALHEFAAGRLARHKLPATVRLVDVLATTDNLKKRRTPSPS